MNKKYLTTVIIAGIMLTTAGCSKEEIEPAISEGTIEIYQEETKEADVKTVKLGDSFVIDGEKYYFGMETSESEDLCHVVDDYLVLFKNDKEITKLETLARNLDYISDEEKPTLKIINHEDCSYILLSTQWHENIIETKIVSIKDKNAEEIFHGFEDVTNIEISNERLIINMTKRIDVLGTHQGVHRYELKDNKIINAEDNDIYNLIDNNKELIMRQDLILEQNGTSITLEMNKPITLTGIDTVNKEIHAQIYSEDGETVSCTMVTIKYEEEDEDTGRQIIKINGHREGAYFHRIAYNGIYY